MRYGIISYILGAQSRKQKSYQLFGQNLITGFGLMDTSGLKRQNKNMKLTYVVTAGLLLPQG